MDLFLFYLVGMVACLLLIMLGLWLVDIARIEPYPLANIAKIGPYDIGDIAKILPYDIPAGAWIETFDSVTTGQYDSGEPPGCDQDGWTVNVGQATHGYFERTAGGLNLIHSDATKDCRLRNNFTDGGLYVDSSHNTIIVTFKPGAAYSNGDWVDFYCSDNGTNSAITTASNSGRLITLDSGVRYSGFGGEGLTNKWNYSTEVEFKFVFDFTAHTYDVYVDDLLTWTDKAFVSASCDYIGRVSIWSYTAAARDTELIQVEVTNT
jgi:hypothetical protein